MKTTIIATLLLISFTSIAIGQDTKVNPNVTVHHIKTMHTAGDKGTVKVTCITIGNTTVCTKN